MVVLTNSNLRSNMSFLDLDQLVYHRLSILIVLNNDSEFSGEFNLFLCELDRKIKFHEFHRYLAKHVL